MCIFDLKLQTQIKLKENPWKTIYKGLIWAKEVINKVGSPIHQILINQKLTLNS